MSNDTACPVVHDQVVNLRRVIFHAIHNAGYAVYSGDIVPDKKRQRRRLGKAWDIGRTLGVVGEPIVDVAETVAYLRGNPKPCRFLMSYLREFHEYMQGWAHDCRYENGGIDERIPDFWDAVRDSVPEAIRTVETLMEWERDA